MFYALSALKTPINIILFLTLCTFVPIPHPFYLRPRKWRYSSSQCNFRCCIIRNKGHSVILNNSLNFPSENISLLPAILVPLRGNCTFVQTILYDKMLSCIFQRSWLHIYLCGRMGVALQFIHPVAVFIGHFALLPSYIGNNTNGDKQFLSRNKPVFTANKINILTNFWCWLIQKDQPNLE